MKKNFTNLKGLRVVVAALLVCITTITSFGQAVGEYGFQQTTATGGQYLAATIANWKVCVTAGTWVGATTATVVVGGSINAYVLSGTTCALSASTSFKNLTIESTASLIAQLGTTSGSPKGVRINGGTLQVDGTMGGLGNAGVDGYLSLEPQSTTVTTTTLQGSGTCTISRLRPSANTTVGNTIKLNMNTTLITTGQAFSTNGAANTTVEVLSGKTVTLTAGYIAISNNPLLDPGTGADNFVVNIYGILDLQSASTGNINLSNTLTNTMKVNIFKGATVTVAGKILAPASTATTGAMTLKVEEGANLTITGVSDLAKGTLEYATAITGSTGASINAIASLTPVKNLTINNTGGVVLSAPTTVSTALTLTAGKLTLGANNLTIGTAGSISGATSSQYVVTDAAGGLIMPIPASTATTTFPIGTTTVYRPATVQYTAAPTAGTLKGRFVATAPTTAGIPMDEGGAHIEGVSPTGYWEMASGPTDGIYTMTVDASNFTKGDGSGAIISSLVAVRLIKRPTGGSWTPTGTTTTTDPSSLSALSSAGLTGFSDFALGASAAVLSVELTNFTAKAHANSNILNWSTATERNNTSFNIQRSANGSDFTNIGAVKGNGTKTTVSDYTFTDNAPLNGINYYRLEQLDVDGKATLSKNVAVVNGSSKAGLLKLYPSVSDAVLTVETITEGATTLSVSDLTGRVLLTKTVHATGFASTTLDISNLSNGLYLLTFESATTRTAHKFVKN
jgi:hypothetical protein